MTRANRLTDICIGILKRYVMSYRTFSWQYSELYYNEIYTMLYRNILLIVFKGLIPFLLLLFANVRLIWVAKKLKHLLPQSTRIEKLKCVLNLFL